MVGKIAKFRPKMREINWRQISFQNLLLDLRMGTDPEAGVSNTKKMYLILFDRGGANKLRNRSNIGGSSYFTRESKLNQ